MRIVEFEALIARRLNQGAREQSTLRTLTGVAARQLATVEIVLMVLLGLSGKRAAAARMLAAVGAVYVACEIIGRAWSRARPFERDADIAALLEHDSGRSFPSRHVASGVAMAVIGGAAHPRLGFTMHTVAWALGATRVAAGLHYPSDVAGGALLGWLVGYILRA